MPPIFEAIEKDYEGQKAFVFMVDKGNLPDWISALSLVKFSVSNSLVTVCSDKKIILKLSGIDSDNSRFILEKDPLILTFIFNYREFEGVLVYLLKYYNNGMADVDHIDVHFESQDINIYSVSFRVEDFRPPMSSEELIYLLNLEE